MNSDNANQGRGTGPLVGDSFHCSSCDRDSLVKSESVMDGWRCVGQRLVCAFCGAPLAGPSSIAGTDSTASASEAEAKGARAKSALAALLGGETGCGVSLDLGESDGRFCKNCIHFLRHPFRSRCLLHERDVEPMDDCDDFEPLPPEEPDESHKEQSDAGLAAGKDGARKKP